MPPLGKKKKGKENQNLKTKEKRKIIDEVKSR